MVIAVDGPAGAGKSTVCKLLARELGYTYLDTGAMYRAVAWALLDAGISAENDPAIPAVLQSAPLGFSIEDLALVIHYREKVLTEELRRPEMAQWASRMSQSRSVRNFLTQRQRDLGAQGDIVAEGRDMTTVVFPDAMVKIFLTAEVSIRAKRRFVEYQQKGIVVDYPTLEAQIRARDEADQNRELAPLRPAPDALLLDTSHIEPPQVVQQLLDFIRQKMKNGCHFC